MATRYVTDRLAHIDWYVMNVAFHVFSKYGQWYSSKTTWTYHCDHLYWSNVHLLSYPRGVWCAWSQFAHITYALLTKKLLLSLFCLYPSKFFPYFVYTFTCELDYPSKLLLNIILLWEIKQRAIYNLGYLLITSVLTCWTTLCITTYWLSLFKSVILPCHNLIISETDVWV